MSTVVAVAGGSRGMGLAIIQELRKVPNLYKPIILSRDSSSVKTDQLEGISIITVNYEDVESIKAALEEHKIHTLISNVFITTGVGQTQQNLICAAEASPVTKRFIPSTFDVPYNDEMAEILFSGAFKLESERLLMMTTTLEWTRIHNGFFLDYYFSKKFRTFLTPGKYVVDLDTKKAIIPGDGNMPVTFTHTIDVAKFVVASLSLTHWPTRLFIAGDELSWNQFVDRAEKASGTKFEREYNSLEGLKSGDMTQFKQLDGWDLLYDYWPKSMADRLPSAIQYFMGSGRINLTKYPLLNDAFPGVHPVTVEDALNNYYNETIPAEWQ